MADFSSVPTVTGFLLVAAAVHLIAGMALGKWFRFGVLLIAFPVILVESLLGDFRLGIAPWYFLLIGGVVIIQLGYAATAYLWWANRPERRRSGSMRVQARDHRAPPA